MAYYNMDETKPLTKNLRFGLNSLRDAYNRLGASVGTLNQMTDAQIAFNFGFPDSTTAAAAKSELLADIGKLTSDASQTNTYSAVQQMLSQFSG